MRITSHGWCIVIGKRGVCGRWWSAYHAMWIAHYGLIPTRHGCNVDLRIRVSVYERVCAPKYACIDACHAYVSTHILRIVTIEYFRMKMDWVHTDRYVYDYDCLLTCVYTSHHIHLHASIFHALYVHTMSPCLFKYICVYIYVSYNHIYGYTSIRMGT